MKTQFCIAAVVLTVVCGVMPVSAGEPEPAHRFIQLADPQLGMGGYEHDVETLKLAVETINKVNPDFVLICGDLVHETASETAFKDFKAIVAGFNMPFYCAAGNHDLGSPPTAETLARYRELIGKDYYAVDRKGLRIVVINTQLWKTPFEEETARHDAWLEQALAEARAKDVPVIIMGHHPLYLKEPGEEEEYFNIPPETRSKWLKLFKESGVIAILTGHAHKEILHKYEGMLLVTNPTTSKNFDGAPMGYRLWEVSKDGAVKHEYIAIEGAKPPAE
jgi:3',5'-cyclic AMP phosphodiesterase CpdA